MTEKPILFSAPMVRAILEGRKSQTRRVVKPQPVWVGEPGVPFKTRDADPAGIIRCPYGRAGGRLWVREHHTAWSSTSTCTEIEYPDGTRRLCDHQKGFFIPAGRRRPSLHMHRWASRITLEITGVRVERVQEISEQDAWSEGFPDPEGQNRNYPDRARYWFRQLWDSINAERGYPFVANPYVWVVEFRRVEGGAS